MIHLATLLEYCSKNTSELFHKCISTDVFVDGFLFALGRIRGKMKVKTKLEAKET